MNDNKMKFAKIYKILLYILSILEILLLAGCFVFVYFSYSIFLYICLSLLVMAVFVSATLIILYKKKYNVVLSDATNSLKLQIKEFGDRTIVFNNNVSNILAIDDLSNDINAVLKSYSRYNISLNPEAYTYDATRYIKLKKIVDKEDFYRLIPIEVERNSSYRFACLAIRVAGKTTQNTMDLLHGRILDVFGDVLVGKNDDSSYLVFIYNVDSLPMINNSINELLRCFHELVIEKDSNNDSHVNYCKIGYAIYPSSNIQSLINDALHALETIPVDKDSNIYIPDNLKLSSRYIKTNDTAQSMYNENMFNFEDALTKTKSYEARYKVFEQNLKIFASMFDLSVGGLLLFDHFNQSYKIAVEYKYSDKIDGFKDLSSLPNEELDHIFNLASQDHCYYSTDSKDVDIDLKPIFNKMNIKSFFFYRAMYLGNKVGLLYFLSEKERKRLTINEYTSMFNYAFFFRACYFDFIKDLQYKQNNEVYDAILSRDNKYIYSVDKETYQIKEISKNLLAAFPNAHLGDVCYKVFRTGHDQPCSHCPLYGGVDNRIIPSLSEKSLNISLLKYSDLNLNYATLIIEPEVLQQAYDDRKYNQVLSTLKAEVLRDDFSNILKNGKIGYLLFFKVCKLAELKKKFVKDSEFQDLIGHSIRAIQSSGCEFDIYEFNPDIGAFGFILTNYNMVKTIDFVERLASTLRAGFLFDGADTKLDYNIVAVPYPTGIGAASDLSRVFNESFKEIDGLGANLFEVFGEHKARPSLREEYIVDLFKEAKQLGNIGYSIQPIVDRDQHVVGAECFVRLIDKLRGPIPPLEFIPLISKYNLMFDTEMSLFRTIGELYVKHSQHIFKAVGLKYIDLNISKESLLNPAFIQNVKDIMKKYQFSNDFIRFEIRSNIAISCLNDAIRTKDELNKIGIELLVDNVSNVATLESLSRMNLSSICIDKVITKELSTADFNDTSDFNRISLYCATHKILTRIEGIETREQFETAKIYDVNSYQGYLFAKPMEGNRFIEFLNYGK